MSTEEANDYIGRFEGKTRGCYAAPVRARGVSMRKVALIVAVTGVMLFAEFLGWRAEATTLTGPATLLAVTHSYSPVQSVACGGPGPNCPAGLHWVCGPRRCWCAPCAYYHPYYRPYYRRG